MLGATSILSGTYTHHDIKALQLLDSTTLPTNEFSSKYSITTVSRVKIADSKMKKLSAISTFDYSAPEIRSKRKIPSPLPLSSQVSSTKDIESRSGISIEQKIFQESLIRSPCPPANHSNDFGAASLSFEGNRNTSTDSSLSFGSSAAGDSFILPVDWHDGLAEDDCGVALFHNDAMDRSMDDPFLFKPKTPSSRGPQSWNFMSDSLSQQVVTDSNLRHESSIRQVESRHDTAENECHGADPKFASTKSVSISCETDVTKSSKSLGTFDFPIETCTPLKDTSNVIQIPHNKYNPKSYEPTAVEDACNDSSCEEYDEIFEDRPISELEISTRGHGNESPGGISCMTDTEIMCRLKCSFRLSSRKRAQQMVEYYKRALDSHHRPDEEWSAAWTEMYVENRKNCELISVAGFWMDLGLAELLATQFEVAMHSFLKASSIYKCFNKAVATARALDRAGVAYCRALKAHGGEAGGLDRSRFTQYEPYLPAGIRASRAMRFLREALAIRQEELGPWHVDTVDTLNHMANLYLLTGFPVQASGIGEQVFNLRRAIFGPMHPAAAVIAHEVANALMQCGDTNKIEKAKIWYQLASEIYQALHLPIHNPAVRGLLKDICRMEAIERWSNES